PRGKRDGLLMLAAAATAVSLTVVSFVGYTLPRFDDRVIISDPGPGDVWRVGLNFLSLGLGAGVAAWAGKLGELGVLALKLGGLGMRVLLVGSGAVLVWVWRSQPAQRDRALGILLFLGAMASLVGGFAWGRAQIEGAGLENRYYTLMVPALCAVYLSGVLRGGAVGRFAPLGLLALQLVILWPNTIWAVDYAGTIRSLTRPIERDLLAGKTPDPVTQTYSSSL